MKKSPLIVKVEKMTPRQLDKAVAQILFPDWDGDWDSLDNVTDLSYYNGKFEPASNFDQTNEIVWQEEIEILAPELIGHEMIWTARTRDRSVKAKSTSREIAAMRCFVEMFEGSEIELLAEGNKVRSDSLDGIALNWAVSKSIGENMEAKFFENPYAFNYEKSIEIAWPIIDTNKIWLTYEDGVPTAAMSGVEDDIEGETIIQAAMRCFVIERLGNAIEIPEIILERHEDQKGQQAKSGNRARQSQPMR